MTDSLSSNLKQTKWPLRLKMFFVVIMAFSFMPWEFIFPIQIRDKTLIWFSSTEMGLIGLLGLLCTVMIYIRRNNGQFSIVAIILLGFLSITVGFMLFISSVIPAFRWYDTDVYRNGNDYLVIQEQETFVTSNQTYPRVIRTSSPYSMIRIVEEQIDLNDHDSRFEGNAITYGGKMWNKELKKE
jgi:fatty acid desaturase